jgi:Domain of unknown function DUF1828
MFEDGDHLAIVLRREADHWVLSDEGHSYMRLTYEIDERDLQKGTRQKVITSEAAPQTNEMYGVAGSRSAWPGWVQRPR